MEVLLLNKFLHSEDFTLPNYSEYVGYDDTVNELAATMGVRASDVMYCSLNFPPNCSPSRLLNLKSNPQLSRELRTDIPTGQDTVATIAKSIALGILEYFKMNQDYSFHVTKDVTLTNHEFLMGLSSCKDPTEAGNLLFNMADVVMPNIRHTDKAGANIIISDNTVYLPNKFKDITEGAIAAAIVNNAFSLSPASTDDLNSYLNYIKLNLDYGDVYEVFCPNTDMGKFLRNYKVLEINKEVEPLAKVLRRQGYILPNLFDTYDPLTQQSMYMTQDNKNVVIVQWKDFYLEGTIVLPVEDAQKIYKNATPLTFVDAKVVLPFETFPPDTMIATITGIPVFELLGLTSGEINSPNNLIRRK